MFANSGIYFSPVSASLFLTSEYSKVAYGNRVFTVAALSSLDGQSQKKKLFYMSHWHIHILIKTNEETGFKGKSEGAEEDMNT